MTGLRLSDFSSALQTNSVVECAIECANNVSCESLSYHSTKGLCLLHSFLFNVTTTEDDWKSYQYCRGNCPTECGYVHNETLDWCYRLVVEKRNASQAAEFCRLDGARQIKINSLDRQLHIMDLLFSQGVRSVWIGGQSAEEDNNFVYEDGSPLSYFHWKSNSPKNRRYIKIRSDDNYEWENKYGASIRAFMCER
ncbi:C-type Lectin CRL-like isoform X2 [Pecten maximus]|uniref:C-type Lectin CRL-like isoform X2 n=1 Tax=Pecten maximus TaxID=6579 RepID=UPI001457F3A3|nr:C-type Lectin CRL-like isoform X2 [Pecten maximus]